MDAPFAISRTAIRVSRRAFANNFNASTKIVSISNFTKHCVMKYFANLDSDKVQVIRTQMAARLPDMVDKQSDAVLTKFGLQKEKYFVFPSRFWVHKNHSGLVKAFAEMLKKYNVDHEFKLVLMGGYRNRRGKLMDTAKSVMSIADQYKIQNRVILTGYVENDEFLAILKGALAVVNPTFYEGFGMPIAEAMLQQKPVVCSGVASLPEIGGDAALYFDPYNINDIADKLYMVYSNDNLRKEMIAKGNEQVKKFTDKEKMLEDMIGLLDEIMKETKQEEKYRINWPFCCIK